MRKEDCFFLFLSLFFLVFTLHLIFLCYYLLLFLEALVRTSLPLDDNDDCTYGIFKMMKGENKSMEVQETFFIQKENLIFLFVAERFPRSLTDVTGH